MVLRESVVDRIDTYCICGRAMPLPPTALQHVSGGLYRRLRAKHGLMESSSHDSTAVLQKLRNVERERGCTEICRSELECLNQ